MIASTPMNVCANPEPGIETNGELKPVAIAFASIVLPVPGAPRKSSPRSRLPPARSNASPDCHSVTTRRTSSFASTWPRTSPSLTPHCASPGSKPRICEMPIISIGPIRIAKLAMKRKVTNTICVSTAGFVSADAEPAQDVADGAPPRAAAEQPDDRDHGAEHDREAAPSSASTTRAAGPSRPLRAVARCRRRRGSATGSGGGRAGRRSRGRRSRRRASPRATRACSSRCTA